MAQAGFPQWRRFGTWLRLGSPLTLMLLVVFFATFDPTTEGAEHGIAGLVQRLLILQLHGWFVAMGMLAYRRATVGRLLMDPLPPPSSPGTPPQGGHLPGALGEQAR